MSVSMLAKIWVIRLTGLSLHNACVICNETFCDVQYEILILKLSALHILIPR